MDPRAAITPALYDHLRGIARRRLWGGGAGPTLQPTALLNEALAKLLASDPTINDEAHLIALAIEAMRQVWIDRARSKAAAKRGGGLQRSDADVSGLSDHPIPPERLLDMDQAITTIEKKDPQLGTLIKLRLFTDLTLEEIGALLGLSLRTVDRRWRYGSALLRRALE